MQKEIHAASNIEISLKKVSKILHDLQIEHFIHGGVLLGYARDGYPLERDDDIDIVLSHEHWHVIKTTFEDVLNWELLVSHEDCFLAFMDAENKIQIDFYFYYDEGDCIREKWNYFGRPDSEEFHILIPKSIIFPITVTDGIYFPANPAACSEYTYGRRWREPMRRSSYIVKIVSNIPRIFYLDADTL